MTHPTIEKAARAFHDGPLMANDYDYAAPENQKSADWCRDVASTCARVILAAEPSDAEVWKIQSIIYSSSEWARMGPFKRARKLGLIFEAIKARDAAKAKEMGLC